MKTKSGMTIWTTIFNTSIRHSEIESIKTKWFSFKFAVESWGNILWEGTRSKYQIPKYPQKAGGGVSAMKMYFFLQINCKFSLTNVCGLKKFQNL